MDILERPKEKKELLSSVQDIFFALISLKGGLVIGSASPVGWSNS